eukprot:3670138-Lingulodinium_polyedra.AAC.1
MRQFARAGQRPAVALPRGTDQRAAALSGSALWLRGMPHMPARARGPEAGVGASTWPLPA